MRAAVYPTNTTRRVLPTNTQQPRKDKGSHYRGGEAPYYAKDVVHLVDLFRLRPGVPRTIVRH